MCLCDVVYLLDKKLFYGESCHELSILNSVKYKGASKEISKHREESKL